MPSKAHILIIDDDANTLASLARAFRLAGHEATVCDNAARALELAKAERFDLILSDVVMPGRDGIALLEDFKSIGLATPVVMMSGQASIEMAVKATRLGASDFLEKPISSEKLLLTVENALRLKHLEEENRDLKRRLGRHHIVWASPAMKEVMAQVEHVAAGETRVCIRGETGTGKELIARTLHEKSARRAEAFVSLNCAAVPSELMETELFGHEKGSFTGAASRHTGKFEQAHGGTLFLDEIGDMPPPCRRNCCACWKKAKSSASAAISLLPWTCAWSSPRIATSKTRSARELFARISTTASSSFRLTCRRCASASRTFASSPNISPASSKIRIIGSREDFRRKPSRSSSAIPGRETSANCATWSSACCSSRPAMGSTPQPSPEPCRAPLFQPIRARPHSPPNWELARSPSAWKPSSAKPCSTN